MNGRVRPCLVLWVESLRTGVRRLGTRGKIDLRRTNSALAISDICIMYNVEQQTDVGVLFVPVCISTNIRTFAWKLYPLRTVMVLSQLKK